MQRADEFALENKTEYIAGKSRSGLAVYVWMYVWLYLCMTMNVKLTQLNNIFSSKFN